MSCQKIILNNYDFKIKVDAFTRKMTVISAWITSIIVLMKLPRFSAGKIHTVLKMCFQLLCA